MSKPDSISGDDWPNHSPLLKTALRYLRSRLCVIPVRADGSKKPALKAWAKFQEKLPNENNLLDWFSTNAQVGIAIICGKVSGNLTVLDFDHPQPFNAWSKEMDNAIPDWRSLCPLIQTPNGGYHVYLRSDRVLANVKLASFQGKAIETRGEGGYVLAPGCPPACHPTGNTYELISGPQVTEWGVGDAAE